MPAERVSDNALPVGRHDVCGLYAVGSEDFVGHVGIAVEGRAAVTLASRAVRLGHMQPPLAFDQQPDDTRIDIVATAQLTPDESEQVRLFLDEMFLEVRAVRARRLPIREYTILPHVREPDDRIPFRRFSCAGFVVEAYREAETFLVDTEPEVLPRYSLSELQEAYPDYSRQMDRPHLRASLGLEGEGPWPVLLAGHVIHSLARDPGAIRSGSFVATRGDSHYPRRESS